MLKLYYAPGACSLADHIALHESGLAAEHERVDLRTKKTEHGEDFTAVNPKGYVPALRLDSGEVLSENVAILDWIATQAPWLGVAGDLGRTHLLEALAFISTELHKQFAPYFGGGDDAAKEKAKEKIGKRFDYIAGTMRGDYLFGDFSVADAYLFVMLTWAKKFGVPVPDALKPFFERMMARDAVKAALEHEGLTLEAA